MSVLSLLQLQWQLPPHHLFLLLNPAAPVCQRMVVARQVSNQADPTAYRLVVNLPSQKWVHAHQHSNHLATIAWGLAGVLTLKCAAVAVLRVSKRQENIA